MVSSAAGGSAKDGSVAGEKTAPIGVFDSGVGGLTVARAIIAVSYTHLRAHET